jgi:hypothetical protein
MTQMMFNDYDPNRLFDTLTHRLGVSGDKALSQKLNMARSVVTGIRQKRLPFGASLIMGIHDVTGISIHELKRILGDRRRKYRIGKR